MNTWYILVTNFVLFWLPY